jgi:hypothetical protein
LYIDIASGIYEYPLISKCVSDFFIMIVFMIEIEVETEVDREEGWDGMGRAHLGGTCT